MPWNPGIADKLPWHYIYKSKHIRYIDLIYVVYSIGFQTYFVKAFKIVVDSWKFSILLLYFL